MDLKYEFPITSQTTDADKHTMLVVRDIVGSLKVYNYLEIGSYLGGSLTPFLRDNACSHILSVDERLRNTPDERGVNFHYNITSEMMIDTLHENGFSTEKLEVFDHSIEHYSLKNRSYDILFIDGEHTDFATFRDFIYGRKHLAHDAIVLFHDSKLIYKSLQMIQALLASEELPFALMKIKNSVMTVLLLGSYSAPQFKSFFDVEEDLERFYMESEKEIIMSLAKHRLSITLQYDVKDTQTFLVTK